MKQAVVCDITN